MNCEFVAENAEGSRIRYVAVAGSQPQTPQGFAIISAGFTEDPQHEWEVLED